MSFLSGRVQTSKYDIFVPYYTQPDQYKDACDSIMSHTRWAVLQRTSMEVWTIAFPSMKHVAPYRLRKRTGPWLRPKGVGGRVRAPPTKR